METERDFKFGFGQKVKVVKQGPECGASGSIINGRIHPDGREEYSVDAPGTDGAFSADELEAAPEPKQRSRRSY